MEGKEIKSKSLMEQILNDVFIALEDSDTFSDNMIKDLKTLSKSEEIKDINHIINALQGESKEIK